MDGHKMTLEGHLAELRMRLLICMGILTVFTIISYYQTPSVIKFITGHLNGSGMVLAFFSVTEAFTARFKLAFILSLIVLTPFILYEVLGFVIPGLKKSERRLLKKVLISVSAVFVVGCVFGYIILLPKFMNFLITFGEEYMATVLSIDRYIGFILWFCLFTGALFTMPLALLLLGKARVLTAKTLKNGRKVVIPFIIAIAVMIIPMNDLLSFIVTVMPLILVYELGIFLISHAEKRRVRPVQASQ